MAEAPKDAIAAFRRSHDEMAAYVERLAPSDLQAQSAASEWTVADVLSHLGSAAEIGLNTLTAGKADMGAAPAVWDRWNAMSPGEKAAGFVAAEGRLVEAFESLDDDALAGTKIDVGFLPAPVDITFLLAMRLSEVALHRWDVEVAFDPSATVAGYLVPFAISNLPTFAGFFAKSTGKTGQVGIRTTDPGRAYVLDLREDGASLEESGSGDAGTGDRGTTLELPAEALLRLTAGRLDPDRTPASVHIAGDLALDDLRQVFPGY